MGFDDGKPQLLYAKFEVVGFIFYGNVREFVFEREIRFLSHPLGVTGNVRTSFIARWEEHVVDLLLAMTEHFSLALTVETLSSYWSKSALFRGGGSL